MAAVLSRAVCAALAIVLLAACGGAAAPPAMGTVRTSQLPPEARQTLSLIAKGGPYPYREDGEVFQNREHLLPSEPSGYYHEFTVPTPGAGDRGARRIVTGERGERYYTADHYASFREIVSG
jgi:ribonuclease T1